MAIAPDKVKRWRDDSNEYLYMPEQYFAGTDVSVFINDKEVIEISSISFQMREQLRPIYGYNSYVYDAMAIGNRIVMGSITIPFVRKNYLKEIFKPRASSRSNFWSEERTDDKVDMTLTGDALAKAREYMERRFGTGDTIELDMDSVKNEKHLHPAYFGSDFEIEDRKLLQKEGFNIYVAYGKQNVQDIAKLYTKNVYSFKNNLDTLLSKGVNVIKNVYIRGHAQTVEINNTLYETYEFIAKDIL